MWGCGGGVVASMLQTERITNNINSAFLLKHNIQLGLLVLVLASLNPPR